MTAAAPQLTRPQLSTSLIGMMMVALIPPDRHDPIDGAAFIKIQIGHPAHDACDKSAGDRQITPIELKKDNGADQPSNGCQSASFQSASSSGHFESFHRLRGPIPQRFPGFRQGARMGDLSTVQFEKARGSAALQTLPADPRPGRAKGIGRGIVFVAFQGASSCVHHSGIPKWLPEKSRDTSVPAGTKLSLHENSELLQGLCGPTRQRRKSRLFAAATSAKPNAICQVNSRCHTSCFATSAIRSLASNRVRRRAPRALIRSGEAGPSVMPVYTAAETYPTKQQKKAAA